MGGHRCRAGVGVLRIAPLFLLVGICGFSFPDYEFVICLAVLLSIAPLRNGPGTQFLAAILNEVYLPSRRDYLLYENRRLRERILRFYPRFHALISRFKELTGCGMLVNTSFNVRGEPIICTPEDAFRCFMGTEIDVLVAGNCLVKKEEQNPALRLDYKSAFQLD